jgi:hypothetical protein
VTAGRGLVNPPASSGTAIEPRHAGRYAAFIHEDQFFRRDRAEAVEELDPLLEVDRGIVFQRVERLSSSAHANRLCERRNKYSQSCVELGGRTLGW